MPGTERFGPEGTPPGEGARRGDVRAPRRRRRGARRAAPAQAVARDGFLLQLALILLVLFGMYVVTYFVFVQNQTRISTILLEGELAHHGAQAGVAAGISWFTNTRQRCPLHELVTREDSDAINGRSAPVPVDEFDALEDLVEAAGRNPSLAVTLDLDQFRPFYGTGTSPSGIVHPAIEKHGTLKITSRCRVGDAERTIVALKDIKVLQTIPYVVSKFTLFTREKAPGQRLNQVRFAKVDLNEGQPGPANTEAPIILDNGPGPGLERRGWVYLGGGEYRLNLTWGRGSWGDQFALLGGPWKITYDPLAPSSLPPGYELLILQRGLFEDVQGDNNLFDHYDFGLPVDDPVGNGAALLHLYGAPPGAVDPAIEPSPTYVLGRVYRRYLDLRYMRETATGQVAYLPFTTVPAWTVGPPSPWESDPPYDARGAVFGNALGTYLPFMSRVAEEPYNRGCDFIARPDILEPPWSLANPSRLRHRMGLTGFLYDPDANGGEVQIRDQDDRRLFDGLLARILTRDMYFPERAVYTLAASTWPRFVESGRDRVPGILHFRGGDIRIDRALDLESGGVIAVSGNIVIEAPVRVKPYGRPLTLASIGGNIEIREKVRVEACLMALEGTISTSTGVPLDVFGAVAAKQLDFEALADRDAVGRIVYDPRLDPTEGFNNRFTVHLSPRRDYYLAE